MIASLAVALHLSPRQVAELDDGELATLIAVLEEKNGRR